MLEFNKLPNVISWRVCIITDAEVRQQVHFPWTGVMLKSVMRNQYLIANFLINKEKL